MRDTDAERALREDIAAIARIDIIPTILDVVCRTTRMRFAAVARVTESRWIACSVKDDISFGLVPGSELRIETTICNEIRQHGQAVIIDNVAEDPAFCAHHTPVIYGFKSYISLPITLPDGTFFGTLCAIDPEAARLNTPEVVGMFRAFAELIALHLEAQQRLDRTEASLLSERSTAELREQFIAVLGHDLRVPLAAITSGAEILQHAPQPDRVTKLAVMMQRSVKRMAELIDNVLDFARGRLGGGLVLERQVESLQPILQQVVDELQSAWPDRVITLDIALPRAVRCDPVRIGQLVANLLGNALAHGAANTPVKLAASIVDGVLDVTVTNTGDRIPDAMLSRMFEPFVHAAGGPRQQGLGLGLYIANEIARAHGGSLAATSCAGEVRFTFRMLVG